MFNYEVSEYCLKGGNTKCYPCNCNSLLTGLSTFSIVSFDPFLTLKSEEIPKTQIISPLLKTF